MEKVDIIKSLPRENLTVRAVMRDDERILSRFRQGTVPICDQEQILS